MNLEEVSINLSRNFSDQQTALFRIDSIAYLAQEREFRAKAIKRQLETVVSISLSLDGGEIESLKMIEQVYNNPKLNKVNWEFNLYRLEKRVKLYYTEQKHPMPLSVFRHAVEQTLTSMNPLNYAPPRGTGLSSSQRSKLN